MSRRDSLGILSGVALAGFSIGTQLVQKDAQMYRGIPESLTGNGKFETYVEENYRRDELDSSVYDGLVDMRCVEGEKLEDEHVQEVEKFFSDLGVDLAVLEREEEIDRQEFENTYDPSTEDVLGRNNSLYDDIVDEVIKNAAAQVFMVPGKQTPYGEKIINGDETSYPDPEDLGRGDNLGANAVALGDRAAVAIDEYSLQPPVERKGHPDMKLYTVVHELGHVFGLGHTDDPGNIMYGGNLQSSRDPNFTSEQAETMRKNLV